MNQWKLVPDGFDEAVDAAKKFYELYNRTVVSGCIPVEQLRFVAALKFFESMLNAAPQPDVQPVAWFVEGSTYHSHEVALKMNGNVQRGILPLYTHPPAADVRELVEALRLTIEAIASHDDSKLIDVALPKARATLAKWDKK